MLHKSQRGCKGEGVRADVRSTVVDMHLLLDSQHVLPRSENGQAAAAYQHAWQERGVQP